MGQRVAQKMKRNWIDFKALKKAAQFKDVLEHYEVSFTKKGDELTAHCPFHEDSKPSFKVNITKAVFDCFGCNAKGNVIEFVQQIEGGPIRQAGVELAKICGLETGKGEKKEKPAPEKETPAPAEPEKLEPNKPITIAPQLDPEHE